MNKLCCKVNPRIKCTICDSSWCSDCAKVKNKHFITLPHDGYMSRFCGDAAIIWNYTTGSNPSTLVPINGKKI